MSRLSICFQRELEGFSLNIDESLPAKGISVLFGESGCGKTTILRAMAGLERLPNSFCQLGEHCWQNEAQGLFVPTHRRPIGYVFQEASLFDHLNVHENLIFGWQRIQPSQRYIQLDDVCQLLGLKDKLNRRPSSLSGGERQRVAIGRALLTSPQLLLMDEPLSALDMARKQELLPYLERLHYQLDIPIVYVSHAPDEVIRLADHLVLLKDGKVQVSDSLTNALLNPASASFFADGASCLLEANVRAQSDGLTVLDASGLPFYISQRHLVLGQTVRARIFASDVSIALERAQDSSILNLLPAQIVTIHKGANPHEVLILLQLNGQTQLLAQLSRYSCTALNLCVGMKVWAQIKAVAIL